MSLAFLPDITARLGERIGVPVVNPVLAALKTAEALVTMRLSHSKQAWPPLKPQEFA
jgi:allantoin racemase